MGQGLEAGRKAGRRRKAQQEAAAAAAALAAKNRAIYESASPAAAAVGVTPFVRENDINFTARNLKPDTTANYFFDDVKVNNFVQRGAIINVSSTSALSAIKINEGVYGSTSKAYAEVLGTSLTGTQNQLYVSDNFITIRMTNVSGNSFIYQSDFNKNDLIYQTVDNLPFNFDIYKGISQPNYTFLGKVKNWEYINDSTGWLVVEPILGTLNVEQTSASSNRIWNLTNLYLVQKVAVRTASNNRFQSGETLTYAANGVAYTTVSSGNSYVALSSVVATPNTANTPRRSIPLVSNSLSRDGISTLVGNTITIVSGTNIGFKANVVTTVGGGAGGNNALGCIEAIVDADLPAHCTSNSIYSIGNHVVNDVGALHGIFHIPSENSLRWLTGERIFTITDTNTHDSNDYKMRAVAKYSAVGKLNTTENARNNVLREQTPSTLQAPPKVTQETQKINDRKFMAQTFFTPKGNEIVNNEVKNAYGMLITSVDLFFKKKPTDNNELLPFTLAICKVENGLPSNEIIAERTLEPGYINISTTIPNYANTSAKTKFSFKDPVPLSPSTEYCVKLMTESPDYEVWTAILGEKFQDELGNDRKVSDQPLVGNLFRSQNASNWNPILNQDLMFIVNRANFSTSKTLYFNIKPDEDTATNILMDELQVFSEEQQFPPTKITYEVKTLLTDGSTVSDFVKVNNKETYKFGKDTDISSIASRRRRLIRKGQVADVNVKVTMTTTDNTVAPIINSERFSLFAIQNIINNGGISNNLITITSSGTHLNAANITVTFSAPQIGSNTATGNVTSGLFSGGKVLGINIINPGAGYLESPTITISEPAATANATAVVNGETDTSGGNILARYQTKVVELEDGFDAGDLVVKMNAIKPSGTNIAVYFKVLSSLDKDPFDIKKWQRMVPVLDKVSKDQYTTVPLEFRYSLSKGQIEYFDGNKAFPLGGTFKYFAIKVRMLAQDPTVVPMVDDLKVVAVPGENPLLSVVDAGFYS